MRALVIAPQPFFTPRGTPLSVFHRTRIAAELGVEIDLLTYGEGEDVELPSVRVLRLPRIRFLEPIKVGPSFTKLFWDILMVFTSIGLLMRRRYDFVHAHEEAAYFCTLLKPLLRFKLVYDMHSRLPQQLINFGYTRSRLIIWAFERLEGASLKAADAVITISPALARFATSRMESPDRHLLIENTLLDEVQLKRRATEESPEETAADFPTDGPIVAYAGTFESYQGIDLLLQAHAKVLEEDPTVLLLLIGGSPDQIRHYRELASRLGILGQCRFTGLLSQPRARGLLKSATLCVSPRTEGDNTPLKVYELLAAGIPFVATRVPSHTQVLTEDVCFLASPTPKHFARTILEGLTNESRRVKAVAAAKALYTRNYSREAYKKKMSRLLEMLA
jgi:glycosyltransferase involved in cell wall biosynthesis